MRHSNIFIYFILFYYVLFLYFKIIGTFLFVYHEIIRVEYTDNIARIPINMIKLKQTKYKNNN